MKTFKVTVTIQTLVGTDRREITVKAKDAKSAERKVSQTMGNRDHWIGSVEVKP